jgi:hypothetical protein
MTSLEIIASAMQIGGIAAVVVAWRASARAIRSLERQRDSLRELLVLSDDAADGLREQLSDAQKLVAAQLGEIQQKNIRIAGFVSADARRTEQRESARKKALAAIQVRKAQRLARLAAEKVK